MCHIGYCPICRQHGLQLTRHHKWKKAVWGRDRKKIGKTIYICRECHNLVEQEITRRENIILKQHPDIYIGTLNKFLGGKL
jgi:5-methylcytosine-specific restriction endonuclease McrA